MLTAVAMRIDAGEPPSELSGNKNADDERRTQRENAGPRLSLGKDNHERAEKGKEDKSGEPALGRDEQKNSQHDRHDELGGENVWIEDPAGKTAALSVPLPSA